MTDTTDRIPPQSLEAEQAVLGCMLIDRQAIAACRSVEPAAFYRDAHRVIFEAICLLADRGEPVDMLTVVEELRRQDLLPNVGGASYIVQLQNAVPAAVNAEHYAQIVSDRHTLRKLLDAGTLIQALAHSEYPVPEILERADSEMRRVLTTPRTGAWVTASAAVEELVEEVTARKQAILAGEDALPGLSTAWADLDYMTRGLRAGDLIVLAARPGMGKTSLALCQALHTARQGVPVAIFSLEMSVGQLILRLLAAESGVATQHIETALLTADQWERFGVACDTVSALPLYIDGSSGVTAAAVAARLQQLAQRVPVGLVAIDYLQIMGGGGAESSRYTDLGQITSTVRNCGKELGCPVILLSQLNRGVEHRTNKRPMLSDLAESGQIEANADAVWFLYREAYYQREAQDADVAAATDAARRPGQAEVEVAELILAKQRSGPTGHIELAWHPQTTRFTNLERRR